MNMNPMQLMSMIMGNNPEKIAMELLQKNMGGTPLGDHMLELAKQGNTQELQNIVRNYMQSKGVDFDKEFTNFQQLISTFNKK